MGQKVKKRSQNGKKRICHIIITHGIWVDEFQKILNYAQKCMFAPFQNMPENFIRNLNTEQENEILGYVENEDYGHPGFCSISGYRIQNGCFDPVFTDYRKHIKRLYLELNKEKIQKKVKKARKGQKSENYDFDEAK